MSIDWQAFCLDAAIPSQYSLRTPFFQDGYRYATNGWIAIRKRARGKANSKGKFPRMADLPFLGCAPWHKWPNPIIDGVEENDGFAVVRLDNRVVLLEWVEMIADLSSVEWSAQAQDKSQRTPLTFRFSGGQGVVMPLDVS